MQTTVMRAAVLAVALFSLQGCTKPTIDAQVANTCAPIDDAGVAALFDRWEDLLEHKPATDVVALYADDSVLLPTLSDQPRYTREQKIDYFAHFQAKHPSGHIDERRIFLGCNSAVDAGLYTFTFGDGTRTHARYTYTYAFEDGAWRITSHHSSAMPEAANAQASRKP
jgi:uncharacterized protein (TIGR02246 family)